MKTTGLSDIGRYRDENEDRYMIRELASGDVLLAVADGLGGQPGGASAAQILVEALGRIDIAAAEPCRELDLAMQQAQDTIQATVHKAPELEGMGSTLVCAWVREQTVYWYSIGDSRLYHCDENGLRQVSKDQTLVQFLLEEGEIQPEQALGHPYQNVLYQCVGCPEPEPEEGSFAVTPGDQLLLSSDGFHDMLAPKDIAALLQGPPDLDNKARAMIQAALNAGSRDNVTVVLAEV